MLHELLLALHGHHGQVFYLDRSSPRDPRLKVNSALPLFHPAELAIIQNLLDLATEYLKLQSFISRHRNASLKDGEDSASAESWWIRDCPANRDEEEEFRLRGLYVESLCEGLDLVLRPYRVTIIQVEKEILHSDNGSVPLSFMQHKLTPFKVVLSSLTNLIRQLYLRRCRGCYVLDFVYKASCSGYSSVAEAMKILLHEGHKVLYKQLLAWILQGSLFDPYDEFFIQIDDDERHESSTILLPAEDRSNALVSTVSKAKRYKLRADLVPNHISVNLARSP